jgi:cell division protein FtsB
MESEITGRQSPTTRNNDRYYGSKKGLNYDTKANERTIEKTNKELNKSKEEITKLEAEVESLSKQYKET